MNTLHDFVNKSLDIEIVKSSMNSAYSTVMSIPYCTYVTVNVVGDTVHSISDTVNSTVSSIGGAANSVGGAVKSTASIIGGTVKSTASSVGGTVISTASRVGETVKSTANSIGGTVNNTVVGTVNFVGGTAKSTASTIGGTVNSTLGSLYGITAYIPQLIYIKRVNHGEKNGTIKEESEDDDDECPTAVSNGIVRNGGVTNGYILNGVGHKGVSNGSVTNGVVGHGVSTTCLDKKMKRVSFEWLGSDRDKVFITGSFYDWRVKLPLNKRSRKFAAQIDLPKGRHEFKFVVNGVWKHSANYPSIQNDFGDLNNYVDVH